MESNFIKYENQILILIWKVILFFMHSKLILFFYAKIVLLGLPFWVSIIDKKIGRKLGLAIVVATTMDRCGAMATMTLAPLDFFFPSATTTIIKMEVDQR